MTKGKPNSILIISILAISFLGLGLNEAFAVRPDIQTFVASDSVYSDGDTLTITFDIATNQTGAASQANINGNFTFSQGLGTTYTGIWTDPSTLVITVTDTTGEGGVAVGVTSVSAAAGNNIGDAVSTPGDNAMGIATLSVLASGGGDGCDGECSPPTLGVTKTGIRLVENGFSYNGNPVNVEYYYTPYPLVLVNLYEDNVVTLKIYDGGGPENIKHVGLAFGLRTGQIMSESKAVIEWDKSWDGSETVKEIDPENAIDNVSIESSIGPCNSNSVLKNDCLILDIHHTFRKPLDFNIVATNVWDSQRNAWQNYYNDGIDVNGVSLDPPKTYQVIHHGKIFIITEFGKNSAIDDYGNTWSFNKTWQMDSKPIIKKDVTLTSKWFDRNHPLFNTYKDGQVLLAQEVFNDLVNGKSIQNNSLDEAITFYGKFLKRTENMQLQQDKLNEIKNAQVILEKLINTQARYH